MTDPTATRYRQRPNECDAIQWTGTNADALRAFAGEYFDTIDPEDRTEDPDQDAQLLVEASHWVGIKPGDWVLKFEGYFIAKADVPFRAVWEPAPVVSPPTDRAALRDRIAEALAGAAVVSFVADDGQRAMREATGEELADAVLAVLPEAADQTAVLREAADAIEAEQAREEATEWARFGELDHETEIGGGYVRASAALLRRLAAEAPQQKPDGARQQPDTEADAYDQRLTTPPSDEACAALRERLDSGTAARRTVQQPDAEARVVAYRSPGTRTLYCVTCARQEPGWQPVPATDVQDWTGCDFCGGRVLAVASQTLGETVARYLPEPEDPARIDRMRPEFTDHASIESIDAQLRRARSQERRWHLRAEWLVSLRQARLEQKARGEWPAAPVEPAAADGEETQRADRIVAYRNPDRPDVLLCRRHGADWWGLVPVTSEDLPDGGTCTWGRPVEDECGVDVLIDPPRA